MRSSKISPAQSVNEQGRLLEGRESGSPRDHRVHGRSLRHRAGTPGKGTLQATIDSLAKAPLTGHRREDLDPPGRSFRYLSVLKSFIIVYEAAGDGIRVVRLLHGARNLAAELATDAGDEG